MTNRINTARLGNWLKSWVQDDGAIYGFHNHSVWGSNPYRLMDFTAEHSTWSSPFLVGMARALELNMNEQGKALLERMLQFQVHSFQENSQYKHVGYQVGETLQSGLIHNAITNVSILLTLEHGESYLKVQLKEDIKKAVLKNLEGTMGWGGGRPCQASCCNQDYARIWSKLLFQRLFKDERWKAEIQEDLDYMIKQFHVSGFPDNESIATYRNITLEQNTIEPAEYYGLMINPLIEAYEQYGESRYLFEAIGICKHIVRSSWIDDNDMVRLHKMYVKVGQDWQKINDTMLISGMALTLRGISRCYTYFESEELDEFLKACHKTYAYYQTKRGFFVSASGWFAESDIAPCTSWQSHDFMYLMEEMTDLEDDFWHDFFNENSDISILLGDNCIWVEDDTYWAIKDYFGSGLYMVAGRKDHGKFGIDMGWIPSNRQIDQWLVFDKCPRFYKCHDKIIVQKKDSRPVLVDSVMKNPIEVVENIGTI